MPLKACDEQAFLNLARLLVFFIYNAWTAISDFAKRLQNNKDKEIK